jgi:DNA-binding HxlR family transcriptional regulator
MQLENTTDRAKAASRRSYGDACAAAHALDLVGERWALLVIRELLLGPKRFNDLKADLPGISANVLGQRLEGLEASGVLRRRRLPPPASIQVYELTPWGYETEPIFHALGRWAVRSPTHDPALPFSAVSLMLSFRAAIDVDRARALRATIGFRLGRDSFLARLADGAIEIKSGPMEGADLVFTGSTPALAAAMYRGVPLAQLEDEGALAVEGDRALAASFVTLFPLPSKAGAEG